MKKTALTILIVFVIFGLMPGSIVSAGGVSPTPWFTIVGGLVTIAGEPAAVGTDIEFFCQENLAGYGVTYDYSDTEKGVLGFTHVYGSDLSTNPQILACEEGDKIKVMVNGVRAVMAPEIHWTNDWMTHVVSISLDTQVTFVWGLEAVASVGMNDGPVGLRKWSSDGSYDDYSIENYPFWQNFGEVKGWSLTDSLGKTKVYSGRDETVCLVGPTFTFSKGEANFIARVENNTEQELQTILRLGDKIVPSGLIYPGGSLEIANTAEIGSIEVRIGDEYGPRCATLEWDYRSIPAPRVIFASGENRIVTIKGDNFIPYLGSEYDPRTFRVWFIRPDSTAISYELVQIWRFGGSWESRQIRFNLPRNFPAGTYMLKVSMSGRSSDNGTYITVPDFKKVYLPIIVR